MEQEQAQQEETLLCQSCGMPMHDGELLGSDADGNKITEYCMYCYEAGEFKQPDITLQGMTDLCTGYMVEEGMEEISARKVLADTLPLLKRWSNATGSIGM
ncbi:zinc ribbon domain-containing protein [Paenibacillus sp. 19GGS1-52]|uniref:zinc ribbon domain-containing protein n=1 Tax=Paenibacillus sp. 19GGS1-52 TaxID=2758563 RepID=UPI001EFB77FB|nr:zinc ribbon domain-containing protein [Paenibacillus sp. 19GGS1-52]ULO06958.1 zinc ribbon domain-containing protein [Paenibacillus sp. 19GGS1-52]